MVAMGRKAACPHTDVHMFWIGKNVPAWVVKCIGSYLSTGHTVFWWHYPQERGDPKDLRNLVRAHSCKKSARLRPRDANDIVPHKIAKSMYYHGMGAEGKYHGWAPFSDYFRYLVMARYGGWWVDADSVSVQNLRALTRHATRAPYMVICTERHRGGLHRLGTVAVDPKGRRAAIRYEHSSDRKFGQWAGRMRKAGMNVCRITNNHFFVGAPNSSLMQSLADEMKSRLEAYIQSSERCRRDSLQQRSVCGLPHGNIGMKLFQDAVADLLPCRRMTAKGHPNIANRNAPYICDSLMFNPIDATSADRMWSVLNGDEKLSDCRIVSIHVFRQVRDAWSEQGRAPPAMKPALKQSLKRSRREERYVANTSKAPFTPRFIVEGKCLARTWSAGLGGQCGRLRNGRSVFCAQHTTAWRSHGRVDSSIPTHKLREFEMHYERRWLRPKEGENDAKKRRRLRA